MTKELKLTQGYVALVDEGDYEMLVRFKWSAHVKKRKDGSVLNVYAVRGERRGGVSHPVLLHRALLGAQRGVDIDHIDGDGLNNTRGNLRVCSRSQNNHNSRLRPDNTSGYKGVAWSKASRKWRAYIAISTGERRHLGLFSSAVAAAGAYDLAAMKYFGEFARTNFWREYESL